MKNDDKKWLFNDLLSILICGIIMIWLYRDYDILQRIPQNRGNHIGAELFVVIDYVGGKKWVFFCLSSIIIFFTLDILKNYEKKQSKAQCFIVRNINRIFVLWAIIIYIIVPVYALIKLHNYRNDIIIRGKKTVVYISKINYDSKYKNTYDATLLYYIDSRLRNRIKSGVNSNCLYKFFILKYLPEDNKRVNVDFENEIPIDSVYQYFPKGKNPFDREIHRLKERGKNNVIKINL
jgi:hypothetical protein